MADDVFWYPEGDVICPTSKRRQPFWLVDYNFRCLCPSFEIGPLDAYGGGGWLILLKGGDHDVVRKLKLWNKKVFGKGLLDYQR